MNHRGQFLEGEDTLEPPGLVLVPVPTQTHSPVISQGDTSPAATRCCWVAASGDDRDAHDGSGTSW